jgi:hypothetical protein
MSETSALMQAGAQIVSLQKGNDALLHELAVAREALEKIARLGTGWVADAARAALQQISPASDANHQGGLDGIR